MSTQPQLAQLENAGLIQVAEVEPELAYFFRHGLIQDAAYSTLLRNQRQNWHLATAQVIESACRSDTETVSLAPILARHFSLAGDRRRASHYLVIAGDAAFDHYANVEAASFYWQALEIANAQEAEYDPQLMRHLFGRHGRALELTSRFDAALDNYRSMEATAQQHGDKALELAAVMARAKIHSTANMAQDLPQAVGLLERASALAHNLDDPVAEAKINWTLLLNNSMAGGDSAQSIGYGQHALELARSRDERELMAYVLTDLWFAFGSAGRWDEARAALQEGLAITREIGSLSIEAESLGRLALTDMVAGRYDECLALTAEAMQVAERLNSDDARALTRVPLGIVYTDRGDLDRAISASEEAIRFGETTGNVTVLIGTRGDLARSYALLGDIDHGLALTQQASADANRFPLIAAWAGSATVHLRLLQGDLASAEAALAELPNYRDLMRRAGFVPVMWSNLGLAEIELALAQGDMAVALAQAHELIGHFEQRGVLTVRPEVRLLQGQAYRASGRYDEALAALQTARAEAGSIGSRRLLWPILAALAEIASALGQAEAAGLRQQASEIVNYIAAHAPTPALRRSFLGRADVQSLRKAVG
jgi:tetratricopeptide (TPR) repeat protein